MKSSKCYFCPQNATENSNSGIHLGLIYILKKGYLFVFIVSFLVSGMFGCSELPCLTKQRLQIGIEFIIDSLGVEKEKLLVYKLLEVKTDSKTFTSKEDRILSFNKSPTNVLKLDIPIGTSKLTLLILDSISRDSIVMDSVKFNLIPSPIFISHECGFSYGYNISSIDSFGGNRFKKYQILRDKIDGNFKSHVKIFL